MKNKLFALKQLRIIGFIEGLSYIVLLFISMPVKYIFKMPEMVKYNGWLHGILFTALAVSIIYTWIICKWKFSRAFIAGVASLLPFGTFLFDKSLKKEQAQIKKNEIYYHKKNINLTIN